MIDNHIAALAEGEYITQLNSILIIRRHRRHIVVVLQSGYDLLKRRQVGVYLVDKVAKRLECSPGRDLDDRAVGER